MVAIAAAFRFLRQPSRPKPPRFHGSYPPSHANKLSERILVVNRILRNLSVMNDVSYISSLCEPRGAGAALHRAYRVQLFF